MNIIKDLREIGITKFAKVNKNCMVSVGDFRYIINVDILGKNPSFILDRDYLKISRGSVVGMLEAQDPEYQQIYVLNGNVYHLVFIRREYLDAMKE